MLCCKMRNEKRRRTPWPRLAHSLFAHVVQLVNHTPKAFLCFADSAWVCRRATHQDFPTGGSTSRPPTISEEPSGRADLGCCMFHIYTPWNLDAGLGQTGLPLWSKTLNGHLGGALYCTEKAKAPKQRQGNMSIRFDRSATPLSATHRVFQLPTYSQQL